MPIDFDDGESQERHEQRLHEQQLAEIEQRKVAFATSPFAFVVWRLTVDVVNAAIFIGIVFLMAQCACDGCILK